MVFNSTHEGIKVIRESMKDYPKNGGHLGIVFNDLNCHFWYNPNVINFKELVRLLPEFNISGNDVKCWVSWKPNDDWEKI